MPKPGQRSLTVSGDVLKKLNKAYKEERKKHPSLTFAGFISETALLELERRNILERSQYLSLIGFQDNILYLKDAKNLKNIIQVYLKDGSLYCENDDSFNCIHVGFALALPEVSVKLLRSFSTVS